MFVVFSQPHYSTHLLVLRSEPTGPRRPTIGPVSDVLVCRALVASPTLSAYGGGPRSVRCAYFVGEPIANSFPKPQRFKSQVHNCSLNQSANFAVSELQTVGLESFYSRGTAVHGMYLQSQSVLQCPGEHLNQGRYVQLWACGSHTFYIMLGPIHPYLLNLYGHHCVFVATGHTDRNVSQLCI